MTFSMKAVETAEPTEGEEAGITKPKFIDKMTRSIMEHNLNTVQVTQYWNCPGFKQGETRTR